MPSSLASRRIACRSKSDRSISLITAAAPSKKDIRRAQTMDSDSRIAMIALDIMSPAADDELSVDDLNKRCDDFIAKSRARMKRERLELITAQL